MANATTEVKQKKTKLDLIGKSAEYVTVVQKECRVSQYDAKKIMARLNCNHAQAQTLIALAQIKDAEAAGTKSAKA